MIFLFPLLIGFPFILIFLIRRLIDKLLPKYDNDSFSDIDEDKYWGSNFADEDDEKEQPAYELATSKRPFTISISDEQLSDLKWRLNNARPLTPSLELIAHEYGINTMLLKKIVDFWKTKYDWKQREIYLNKFPQYRMNIQGLDIHFIHAKPVLTTTEKNSTTTDEADDATPSKKIVPILLVHSWPGSIREFYRIISRYITPTSEHNFVFEVIAPHTPGFGFSQATTKPGLGATEIAIIFHHLMKKLNFTRYYCQGGGTGAIILQALCVLYPQSILGYHTTMPYVITGRSIFKYILSSLWPSAFIRKDHYNRVLPLSKRIMSFIKEYGFLQAHVTKSDTLGVALNDSPVGLAAYIIEKFIIGTHSTWKNRMDGGLLEKYSYTDLLDIVMIYWWSGTATTSLRFFAETFNTQQRVTRFETCIPVAIARFKHDFYVPDGILKEIFPNIIQLNDYGDGGHFPSFEIPDILADDVFAAVEKFEDYNKVLYTKETTEQSDTSNNANINYVQEKGWCLIQDCD